MRGAAVINLLTDGLISRLRLTGITENRLKAADFIFAGAAPVTTDGAAGRDDLFGSTGNDTLRGLGGNDRLFGDAGDDVLEGGGGSDQLFGGADQDQMSGGGSADTFVFRSIKDSGRTRSAADVILDFTDGVDLIDVSAIDANLATAGNGTFVDTGGAAFTAEGQMLVEHANGNTFISFNVKGADTADMVIKLIGLHNITAADVIL